MYDFGDHFRVDVTKAKTSSTCVFRGTKYRISILSDSLIRFEYNELGKFNDYPTLFASNRSFSQPKLSVIEDNEILEIKNEKFTIEYHKDRNYIGSAVSPDANLRVTVNESGKTWYFNHPEARNLKGTAYSLDGVSSTTLGKGLFSLDGFSSIDDSKTPILNENGNILLPVQGIIDTYLFVYNSDFGVGLKDYFNLTGLPPLIPRYALGVWWAKNENYNEKGIQDLLNSFRKNEIPFSVLLLGEYARNKNSNCIFL
jgi:alpha-glucosidase (family GH31 glycosyl hydrolase)